MQNDQEEIRYEYEAGVTWTTRAPARTSSRCFDSCSATLAGA